MCLSVCPWRGSHVTITHDAFDLTIQELPSPSTSPSCVQGSSGPVPLCTGTPTSDICWPIPDTRDLFKLVHLRTATPASDIWWSRLETSLNLFTWGPLWSWHLVTDFWSTYSWRANWNALLLLVRKAWRQKQVIYLALLDRHWEIKPSDGCSRELMISKLLSHSSILIQTLREAPSGPHVQGLDKHVYLDRLPSDTHCWNVLLVLTALETWIYVKKTKQERNESFLISIRKFT